MRPSVKLVEGYHLTAVEKRTILEGFELLKDSSDWDQWVQRPRSPKRYLLTPDPKVPHRYEVVISANYRTDYGEWRDDTRHFVVDLKGVTLPGAEKAPRQLDLF